MCSFGAGLGGTNRRSALLMSWLAAVRCAVDFHACQPMAFLLETMLLDHRVFVGRATALHAIGTAPLASDQRDVAVHGLLLSSVVD